MNHHQGFPRRRADKLRGQEDKVVRHTHPKYGPKGVLTRLTRGARLATPPCRAVFFTFSFPPLCYLRAGFQISSLPGPRIHLRRTRGWLLRAWWPRSRCVVCLSMPLPRGERRPEPLSTARLRALSERVARAGLPSRAPERGY